LGPLRLFLTRRITTRSGTSSAFSLSSSSGVLTLLIEVVVVPVEARAPRRVEAHRGKAVRGILHAPRPALARAGPRFFLRLMPRPPPYRRARMTKAPPYCTTRSSVMRYEDRRNFREYLTGEVRRIPLLGTWVDKGNQRASPAPAALSLSQKFITVSDTKIRRPGGGALGLAPRV
jgi:hypothetical protein